MAAFNFPNSPSVNDLHTENGVTFKWNGTIWLRVGNSYSDISTLNVSGISTFNDVVNIETDDNNALNIIDTTASFRPTINFKKNDSGTVSTLMQIRVEGTNGLDIKDGSGNRRLRIKSDGKVGIGTDDPNSLVNVYSGRTSPGTSTVYPFTSAQSGTYSYTPYLHELTIHNDIRGTEGSFAGIFFRAGSDSDGQKIGAARISAVETGDYKADLVFGTRNTTFAERLRITSTGRVGIGTDNPSHELDIESVHPTIELKDSDNNYIFQLTQSGSATYVDFDTAGGGSSSLRIRNATNEKLRITSAGKVGINEDDPQALLHVANDNGQTLPTISASFPLIVTKDSNSGIAIISKNDAKSILAFGDTDDADRGKIQYTHTSGSDVDSMQFLTAGSERLRIDSSGDVKFWGTTTNNSTNKSVNLTAPSWNTGEEDVNLVQVENEQSFNQISFGGGTSGLNAATTLRFLTASAVNTTAGTERLRIDSSGRVGINESSPQSLLDIHDSTSANDTPEIRIESFRPIIRFADRSGAHADSEICGDDGIKFRISTESDNDTALTERVRITSGGQLHVGNTTNNAINNALFKAVADDGEAANLYVGQFINREATAGQSFGVNIQAGSSSDDHGFRVKNRANDAFHFLVRGDGKIGIGTDNPGSYKTQIETTDQNVLRLVTDSDDANGVELVLRKDSASPADNDNIGNIYFQGNDDSGNATFYSSIEAYSDDVSNNSENGYIRFRTRNNGSMGERLRICSDGRVGIKFLGDYTMNPNSTNLVIGDGGSGVGMTLWTASGADNQTISFQTNETLSRAEGEISYGPSHTTVTNDRHAMMFRANSNERLRITSGGEVLIGRSAWGSNAHPNDINKLVVTGTSPADAYDSQLYLEGSETSGAVDTGGALAFGGHDGGSYRNWANIYGMKENGTGSNTASYMAFHTRENGGNPAEKLRITSGGQTRMNPPAANGSSSLISEKQALIGTKHFYTVFHTFSGGAGSVNSPLAVNSKIPTNTCGTVEIMAGWANGNGLRYQKYSWIASGATSITQRINEFNSRYGVSISVSTPTMSISGDWVNWSFAFSDGQGSKMENLKIHFEYFHQFRVDG